MKSRTSIIFCGIFQHIFFRRMPAEGFKAFAEVENIGIADGLCDFCHLILSGLQQILCLRHTQCGEKLQDRGMVYFLEYTSHIRYIQLKTGGKTGHRQIRLLVMLHQILDNIFAEADVGGHSLCIFHVIYNG